MKGFPMYPRADSQHSLQTRHARMLVYLLTIATSNLKEFGGIDGLSAKYIAGQD